MAKKQILHFKDFEPVSAYNAGALKIIHTLEEDTGASHSEMHAHDYYEVIVILRGSGFHQWENRTVPLHPGNVFLLKPYEYHRYDYNEPLSLINFMFSRKFFAKYKKDLVNLPGAYEVLFSEKEQPELYATPTIIAELDILFNRINDEMRMKQPENTLLIELRMLNALVLLLRCFNNPCTLQYKHSSGIDIAMAYMQEHFSNEMSLASLAKRAGLSPSSFYRKFCQAFGESPKQWMQKLRIQKAGEFLLRTDKKVFEVASLTGFSDPLYFSRFFHKMTGFTPSEYRSREHGDLLVIHDSN